MTEEQQTTADVQQESQKATTETSTEGGGSDGAKCACSCGGSERYSCLFRLCHWLLLISGIALFLTGISIHKSTEPGYSGIGIWGQTQIYHLWGALVFAPAAIATILIARGRLCKVRNWSVCLLMFAALLMVISGLVILACPASIGLLVAAEKIHKICGMFVLPILFLIHAVRTLCRRRRGLIIPSFSLRPTKCGFCSMLWFIPLVAITTGLILYMPGLSLPGRDLDVKPIDEFLAENAAEVTVDGAIDPTKLPWDDASTVSIPLRGGANFDGTGKTVVDLSALCSTDRVWVRAQWDDPVEDHRNKPWKKTEEGWERMESSKKDETIYYEDKFSILFPIENDPRFDAYGCLAYCHLDPNKGWGCKGLAIGDTHRVDVWHWKATRTNPIGQLDDKWWGEADFDSKTAGRHGDSKPAEGLAGGYKSNVGADDSSVPAFLPDDSPDAVREGAIMAAHAVPYTEELAASIEPGTIVPGMVVEPFIGDRGDVSIVSNYKDGRWTLYMSRKRDTDSECDVRFSPEGIYPFAVAAFEHAAKRHAYHYSVYRLVFPPEDPNVQPAVDKPADEEPAVEPVAVEPAVDEPTVDEPEADQPVIEETEQPEPVVTE